MSRSSDVPIVPIDPNTYEWKVVQRYWESKKIREANIDEYDKMSTGWREAYLNSHKMPFGMSPHVWNNDPANNDSHFYFTYVHNDGIIGHAQHYYAAILCKWPTHATREFIAANGHLVTDEDKKLLEMGKAMAAAPVRVVEKKASHLLLVSALRGQLKS